jgi:alpha-D-xyloside xylohydrolase
MFGPAFLISPVTAPEVRSWETYLPKTQGGWYDFRTGKHYEGGQTVTTTVTKAYIPVFVRAGSIIPLSEDEVLVYPGADASFTLYEDDGTTMAYEQGKYSRTTFRWNDARKKLNISPRKKRKFKVRTFDAK